MANGCKLEVWVAKQSFFGQICLVLWVSMLCIFKNIQLKAANHGYQPQTLCEVLYLSIDMF